MNYSKPEIEIIEITTIDVIATSGGGTNEETEKPNPGGSGTPIVPLFSN